MDYLSRRNGFALVCFFAGTLCGLRYYGNKERQIAKKSDKYASQFYLLQKWMKNKRDNKYIKEYLNQNNYKRVAIYGWGAIGQILMDELMAEGIDVACVIDRNNALFISGREVRTPDDPPDDIDVIIVTVISEYKKIKDLLITHSLCPVISIEDVLEG